MNINDCLKEKLLKKIPPDLDKVNASIAVAQSKFDKAKELLNASFFDEAVLTAYTSMFHAARAVLYRDGFQERSYYAVYVYLKEKYSNKISKVLLNVFSNYQKERHNILYGFDAQPDEEEATGAVFYASDFIISIKIILGLIKTSHG